MGMRRRGHFLQVTRPPLGDEVRLRHHRDAGAGNEFEGASVGFRCMLDAVLAPRPHRFEGRQREYKFGAGDAMHRHRPAAVMHPCDALPQRVEGRQRHLVQHDLVRAVAERLVPHERDALHHAKLPQRRCRLGAVVGCRVRHAGDATAREFTRRAGDFRAGAGPTAQGGIGAEHAPVRCGVQADRANRGGIEEPHLAGAVLHPHRPIWKQRVEACAIQPARHGLVIADATHPAITRRTLERRAEFIQSGHFRRPARRRAQRRAQGEAVQMVIVQPRQQHAAARFEHLLTGGGPQAAADLHDPLTAATHVLGRPTAAGRRV